MAKVWYFRCFSFKWLGLRLLCKDSNKRTVWAGSINGATFESPATCSQNSMLANFIKRGVQVTNKGAKMRREVSWPKPVQPSC